MKRVALAVALCSALFAPAHAWADPNEDLQRAKESFKAGATAYAAGDYLAAIQALDAAYQLTPLPQIAFSLAQAERRQYFVDHSRAHLERSVSLFRRYVDLAPGGARRADALEALSQLEPLVAAGQPEPSKRPARTEESARRTLLLITSDAPGAHISLDGAPAGASPLIREVEPGKHQVRVEAPGYFATSREATAIAGELILTPMPLKERPSVLSIWTNEDAEIYIDGVYVSEGGDGVQVQLPSGKHRLAVARKGHRLGVRELTLERGKAQTVRVSLEPTAQRTVSEALFIGGGVMLGQSLIFSSLAIRAEGQAETFLGRREVQNLDTSEVLRYRSAIVDRDRFVIATGLSLAGAAGFFITGLFLHELDQPNPQQPYRSVPRSAPKPSVQLSPTVSGSGLGLTLGGTF